MVFDIGKKI